MDRTTTSPEFRPMRIWTAAPCAPGLLGVALHRLLHSQRGVAGPDGVVFVGERRPEERHDAVAHHLVDGALVAMDRLHHALQHRVEELPRFLGVAVGEQLHRALEVGEQNGDLLALALQGGLGGEDLLGEVPGRVGVRGWRDVRPVALPARRAPHSPQNFWLVDWARCRRAHGGESGATVPAELLAGRVLMLAGGTVHPWASLVGGPRLARAGQESQCWEAQPCYGTGPLVGWPAASIAAIRERAMPGGGGSSMTRSKPSARELAILTGFQGPEIFWGTDREKPLRSRSEKRRGAAVVVLRATASAAHSACGAR